MATIKSFTDLEQSKALSKILPIESADMIFLSEESLIPPKVKYNGMAFFNSDEEIPTTLIHCWSLAALLSVLPKLHKLQHSEEGYYCSLANYKYITEAYNNPVDACYEMILKLHELNLL